jgi:transcriptional regulator with XRE-family HTH domain
MARLDLTIAQVVRQTGVDARTVKGILSGDVRPHARTLHRIAEGLGVAADELFQNPSVLAYRLFDRWTNPVVDEVTADNPELFSGWSEGDFDELYSRFGVGGPLTREGVRAAAEAMNRKRELHRKLAVVLETSHADLVAQIVDAFYRRIVVAPGASTSADRGPAARRSQPAEPPLDGPAPSPPLRIAPSCS